MGRGTIGMIDGYVHLEKGDRIAVTRHVPRGPTELRILQFRCAARGLEFEDLTVEHGVRFEVLECTVDTVRVLRSPQGVRTQIQLHVD